MTDCILTIIWMSIVFPLGVWGMSQSFSLKAKQAKQAWITLGFIIVVSIIFGLLIFYS